MNPWHCLNCGALMHREFSAPAQEVVARAAADGVQVGITHVCGDCKTFHQEDGAGGLRLLTGAEQFELRMEFEEAARAAERLPAGAIIVGKARKT